ncbi:hypothetical protein UlMin_034956 [Ulmus minor]
MKRGKDDEKITGPMFPRLHVNDTEKGGPRAPPRNKMALYEQLSIPSQRFNQGAVSLNPKETSKMFPPASSNQGSGLERNFPPNILPSARSDWSDTSHAHNSDGVNGNAPPTQLEQRQAGDEDDFMVPIFVQARLGKSHVRNGNDREEPASISSADRQPMKPQKYCEEDPTQINLMAVDFGQAVRSAGRENMKAGGQDGNHSLKSATNKSTREKIDGHAKEARSSLNQDSGEGPVSYSARLHDAEACSQQGSRVLLRRDSVRQGDDLAESEMDTEEGNVSQQGNDSNCGGDHSGPYELENESENNSSNTYVSLQHGNVDKGDDVSETSMVDSVSGLDISPDDAVGIIGQKHFWKARRAMSNQQRVFAVQVFELHRLIKVQRLIAESPHLLLEESAFLGKSSLKASTAKKLMPEFVLKPVAVASCKDDSEKANNKMEHSAENGIAKTSFSSVKQGSQSYNYGQFVGNPPPAMMPTENNMGPWGFPQQPGHQWLIPVMSPSEGLIYKPYLGPQATGSACGGYGSFGSTPVAGSFSNSSYGMPTSHHHHHHHHHHGMGGFPGNPLAGNAYFPPYGMPGPNISGSDVEQPNQLPGPGSHSQPVQPPGGGVNSNTEQQSSCNGSTQNKGAVSQPRNSQTKGSELQGSTASSPGERAKGIGNSQTKGLNADKGRDPLPLSTAAEGASQSHETGKSARVIRVVPHNARSATESAARIFRSIQEERKQFDSI